MKQPRPSRIYVIISRDAAGEGAFKDSGQSSSQFAVFFCCVISLALGVVFFYGEISLAPVQLGLLKSHSGQSVATLPFEFHIFLGATFVQTRAFLLQACLL